MYSKTFPLIFLSILACGKAPKPAPGEPATPRETITYGDVTTRLGASFLDGGWVVSRDPNGESASQGDSLIFSGLALYGLPCDAGEPIAKALEAMLTGGTYYRYPGDSDPVSMDGMLGLYRGVTGRLLQCNELARWQRAFRDAGPVSLPAGFDFVRQKLMAKLELGGEPKRTLQDELETTTSGWTIAVVQAHEACYRIHLALIALQTVESLGGKISDIGRRAFCDASKGTGIATVENFCGRSGLDPYLQGFSYNEWEYKHQRCDIAGWETPDGNGLARPGVDYLLAYMDKILGT